MYYKELINNKLDTLDVKQLRLVYWFIRGIIKEWVVNNTKKLLTPGLKQ